MQKHYIVDLTADERAQLIALTRKGKASARQVTRAHVLLHAADGLTDAKIATAAHTSIPTVARIRKRFVQGRVQEAIIERYRKGGRPKLDLKQEAQLIAFSCSTPPEGRKDWTMQLLADRLVEVGVVDEISDETVRRMLKKTGSSHGRSVSGAWARLERTSCGGWRTSLISTLSRRIRSDR